MDYTTYNLPELAGVSPQTAICVAGIPRGIVRIKDPLRNQIKFYLQAGKSFLQARTAELAMIDDISLCGIEAILKTASESNTNLKLSGIVYQSPEQSNVRILDVLKIFFEGEEYSFENKLI